MERNYSAIILILMLLLQGLFPLCALGQESFVYDRTKTYYNYIERYKETDTPLTKIIIPAETFERGEDSVVQVLPEYHGRENVLQWGDSPGTVDWVFEIPETGLYRIAFGYMLFGKQSELEFELRIDDELLFNDMDRLRLFGAWQDENEIRQDNRGNDIRPRQIPCMTWLEEDLSDKQGLYDSAYLFYFTQGEHRISLSVNRGQFVLDYIKIYNQPSLPTYEDYIAERSSIPAGGGYYKVQAESALVKSHPTLHPIYDRSSPLTEPADPAKLRLNTFGGMNWKEPGQWVTWEITVDEPGFYNIGMRYRQNFLRGLFVTRRLFINGEAPFEEMLNIRFPYSRQWQVDLVGGEEPYLFFFPAGVHQITMEVALGDLAETLRVLEDAVYELNDLYRHMIMIMGTNPDMYRDYNLEENIPDLLPRLSNVSKILEKQADRIAHMTGERGSEAALIDAIVFQLNSLVRRPETIKERLDRYKSNVSSLSAWILQIREQPLELDYLFVISPGQELPRARANRWESFVFNLKAFTASFTQDYATVGDVFDEKEALRVWIGQGRDQAQVVKNMIDDWFTPETGIRVNLELVQGGLIEAILAGEGPDVAIDIARAQPVNLGLRGALVDLHEFPDFPDIQERFAPGALRPYTFEGKVYGLPVTQVFQMMFYRKDIFAELEIEPPETWDDFYKVVPIIQRRNMEVGLPYQKMDSRELIDAGMGANNLFSTLLFQHGADFYNESLSATAFDTPEAYDAFEEWTGFYTRYSFPLVYDFYNRFRTGEMPLAIQPYTQYNLLSVGAPEIRNLWGMLPIPGTRESDGTINRSEGASGSAAVILKNGKDHDAAWEFLKWWTSAEVQERFGRELETLMGPSARYATANVEAFSNLPWSREDLSNLLIQWEQVREVPEVPGGYYTARSIDNAFREVTFDYRNPREAFVYHNRKINEEIRSKRLEFGLDK